MVLIAPPVPPGDLDVQPHVLLEEVGHVEAGQHADGVGVEEVPAEVETDLGAPRVGVEHLLYDGHVLVLEHPHLFGAHDLLDTLLLGGLALGRLGGQCKGQGGYQGQAQQLDRLAHGDFFQLVLAISLSASFVPGQKGSGRPAPDSGRYSTSTTWL